MTILGATADPQEAADPPLRGWSDKHRRVVIASVAVALLPLLVTVVRALLDHKFAVNSDDALIELRVRDIGRHTPLTGSYGRFGWNHPGPMLFFVLWLPYRLLGSEFAGLQIGALFINAAAISGIAVIAFRRGGTVLAMWSLLLTSIVARSLGADQLADPWEPHITVLLLALLLFLAWDTWSGRIWALPLTAAVATLIVEASATAALVAGSLLLLAACGLLRRAPGDPTGRAEHRKRAARVGTVTVGVLAVLWTPPVVDMFTQHPGNLEKMWSFFRSSYPKLGVSDGYATVALQFDHRAPWLRGRFPLMPFVGVINVNAAPVIPVALIVLVVVTAAALRRRDEAAGLAVAVLVLTAAGVLALSRLAGELFAWIPLWTDVIGMSCWVAVGWISYRALSVTTQTWLWKALVPVLAVGVVLVAALTGSDALRSVENTPSLDSAVRVLSARVAPELRSIDGPMLVSSKVHQDAVFGGDAAGQEVLVLALDRAGVDVVVDKNMAYRYGPQRARPGRAVAELQLRSGRPPARSPDTRVLAQVDPIGPATRAAHARVVAELAAYLKSRNIGLRDLRKAARHDAHLRSLLKRNAAYVDVRPLNLVLRRLSRRNG